MENTAVPIKKKKIGKFWKYLIRIFLSILIFFVVLIGTATLIIYFSQEKIKKFIVSEINKELKTEIKVKDVDLSLFHKFPFVSLTFTDVTAKDAITSTNKGDLLIAEHVYLQFNIWDLFTKDYKIKRIDIKNATLTLLVYKDSTDNYHFWKADTTKSNDKFSFDLQKVVLDNVNLRYINFAADQDYSALAKDMVVKGKEIDCFEDTELVKAVGYDFTPVVATCDICGNELGIEFINIDGLDICMECQGN